jgi:hypothetical protein
MQSFDKLIAFGKQVTPSSSDASREFINGMGCALYRFRSCGEAIDSMAECWNRCNGLLDLQAHYRMQRDLFSFFSSGVSSIEGLCYACYVLAAHRQPATLDWSDLKERTRSTDPIGLPKKLRNAKSYPSNHQFIAVLDRLANRQAPTPQSQEWQAWNSWRNTMIHRSLYSRLTEGASGKPAPPTMLDYVDTWSSPELKADENQMRTKLQWLGERVREISESALQL